MKNIHFNTIGTIGHRRLTHKFYGVAFCMLIMLQAFLPGCKNNPSESPLKFKAFGNNPVLCKGAPGEWDEIAAIVPFALIHDHVFYLFYSGFSENGKVSIGLATSSDGFYFEKHPGNPVFTPGSSGFDSYHVGSPVIFRDDSVWVMYYNGAETALYGPAPYIGRATAKDLTGPWRRTEKPVLTRGSMSEWDGEYIMPNTILRLEDGSFRIYYTGGGNYPGNDLFSGIGMATSTDGIKWVKYNDPATADHPYADSDPVLQATKKGDFYDGFPWSACVIKISEGFGMYYGALDMKVASEKVELAYATSPDGIHWEKHPGNPVYKLTDDPVTAHSPDKGVFEFPSLVFTDSLVFMYYDYDVTAGCAGVATAKP
jgi:predicted GH43/DUF377 family glycosyl hydrolase